MLVLLHISIFQMLSRKHFKKSVHPTSHQILQLDLKLGPNKLEYEVYSRLQGK